MMKKGHVLIAFVVLCFAACTRDGYRITGAILGAQDGDTVMLFLGQPGDHAPFKKGPFTTVKEGRFELTGRQDTAALAYIGWMHKERIPIFTLFCLENAEITMVMDSLPDNSLDPPVEILGTPVNESLTTLKQELEKIRDEWLNLKLAIGGPQSEETNKKLEALDERRRALYKPFIAENIQNVVGQHFLITCASFLNDSAFVREQLSAIRECDYTDELRELRDGYEDLD